MYEHLFTPPEPGTTSLPQTRENPNLVQGSRNSFINNMLGGETNLIETISTPTINSREIGNVVNTIRQGVDTHLTNDYLVSTKLTNNATYSSLKNKTIYASSMIPHASLNSGIL